MVLYLPIEGSFKAVRRGALDSSSENVFHNRNLEVSHASTVPESVIAMAIDSLTMFLEYIMECVACFLFFTSCPVAVSIIKSIPVDIHSHTVCCFSLPT